MVKVTAKNGVVVTPTKNPELSQVRVQEKRISYEGGFRTSRTLSALITGPTAELNEEFSAGQELPGRIVVLESLMAFRKDNPEKDYKMAGKTGVYCVADDQPIFRTTVYTADANTPDELIPHTNKEQIKAAFTAMTIVPQPEVEFQSQEEMQEMENEPLAA